MSGCVCARMWTGRPLGSLHHVDCSNDDQLPFPFAWSYKLLIRTALSCFVHVVSLRRCLKSVWVPHWLVQTNPTHDRQPGLVRVRRYCFCVHFRRRGTPACSILCYSLFCLLWGWGHYNPAIHFRWGPLGARWQHSRILWRVWPCMLETAALQACCWHYGLPCLPYMLLC